MHIHLDPVGGVAGDMFVSAILDCFPELIDTLSRIPEALGLSDKFHVACQDHNNGVLTGRKFIVNETEKHGDHHHTSFRSIRANIETSTLSSGVR